MLPSVSILLLTFQGEKYLKETLPAIAAQNYNGRVEILAIDSGSTDQSVNLLHCYGANVFVISQSEFGHGKTRNLAVKKASGEIVVFLSQDACPVGTCWLQKAVSVLENQDVGAAFARQLPRPNATPLERFFHDTMYGPKSRLVSPLRRGKTNRPFTREEIFFSNVCSMARRDVCLRFPFNESIVMSEDQFFARDLLCHGLGIAYAAQVKVLHSHSYDLKTLFQRNFDSGASITHLTQSEPWRDLRKAAQFVGKEVRYLYKRKNWRTLLLLPFYEVTRFSALFLGAQHKRLPRRWLRKLSQHHHFWTEN